jgi:GDPmannose 4,6-dehydratase
MSPYAVSKIAAYYYCQFYRKVHGMFICTGTTFNHESPFRHEMFVTRKITKAVARMKVGLQQKLVLGNMYAKRDWGHAFDYIKGFWMMLNKQEFPPQDFNIATSQANSVKEFTDLSFRVAGFENIEWIGEGIEEKLI